MAAVFPRSRFFVRGLPGSNFVHLTFDDGPHPEYTPRLLETLRRYGVTASFFVVGRMAERYPHLIRRMAAEGHVIGNHSFLHAHLHHMSAGEMFRGVLRTQRLLTRLTGQAPTLYRPPRGKIGARHLLGLWRHGLTVALWNVDARDYACRSAAELQAWFRQRPLKGGDIVLFHDRVAVAAAALPELIQSARDRGLTFVPLTAWTRPAARGQRLPA
jgi:peptidoglycan/xylan/chitin deacetylase (PgdA/CDA1 family)